MLIFFTHARVYLAHIHTVSLYIYNKILFIHVIKETNTIVIVELEMKHVSKIHETCVLTRIYDILLIFLAVITIM